MRGKNLFSQRRERMWSPESFLPREPLSRVSNRGMRSNGIFCNPRNFLSFWVFLKRRSERVWKQRKSAACRIIDNHRSRRAAHISLALEHAVEYTEKNTRSRVTRPPVSGRVPPHERRREINFHPRLFRNKKPVSPFAFYISLVRQRCYDIPLLFVLVTLVNDLPNNYCKKYRKIALTRRVRSPHRKCISPRYRVSRIHRTTTPWRSSAQPDDRTLTLQSAKLQTLSLFEGKAARAGNGISPIKISNSRRATVHYVRNLREII